MGKNELSLQEEAVGLLKPLGCPGFRRDRAVPPKPWVLCREAWGGQCLGQLSHPHFTAEADSGQEAVPALQDC